MTLIAIFIVLIFVASLISAWVERSILTMPIVFTTAGMLTAITLSEIHVREDGRSVLLALAEVGLVLLLFTDASRTELQILKNILRTACATTECGTAIDNSSRLVDRVGHFSPALILGGWHTGRHPCADRCRFGSNHRQQPPCADEDPPGFERRSWTQRRYIRPVPIVLYRDCRRQFGDGTPAIDAFRCGTTGLRDADRHQRRACRRGAIRLSKASTIDRAKLATTGCARVAASLGIGI